MKSLLLIFALAFAPAGHAASDSEILSGISGLETNHDPAAIGRAGERSEFQFIFATWREYTSAPFIKATTDPVLARMVARAHLQRIHAELREYHCAESVTNIGACWNGGLACAWRGASLKAYSYGQKLELLVQGYIRRTRP